MECVICYEQKEASEFTTTECDHCFCKSCLDNWTALKNSCPMCRKTIKTTESLILPYDFTFYIINDNDTVIVFYYDTHINR